MKRTRAECEVLDPRLTEFLLVGARTIQASFIFKNVEDFLGISKADQMHTHLDEDRRFQILIIHRTQSMTI